MASAAPGLDAARPFVYHRERVQSLPHSASLIRRIFPDVRNGSASRHQRGVDRSFARSFSTALTLPLLSNISASSTAVGNAMPVRRAMSYNSRAPYQ